MLTQLYVRMLLYVDGVCIKDRTTWLAHKKLKRELILNTCLVRGSHPEFRKEGTELKKNIEILSK